ncbi:Atp25p [Sugiyamaella lignohabitans]|uniref:ATPase synthesis protein 25 n=1 Tax=Sugiyamaella lignohabitans TaxID=796027 RepID=A0A167EBF7_9ASCO|nr:Atp25p [Sugiyamaella lignohabitans]ANB13870.1 Atp25p [Sugiyamaella lignohabitans]
MASRRVIYTLLEPVTRPYFAPYRHNYNQRQQEKRRQALQRKWISTGVSDGVVELTEEEAALVASGHATNSAGSTSGSGTSTVIVSSSSSNQAGSISSSVSGDNEHSLLRTTSDDIPWYLRNTDTIKATESLQSREPLPDFPFASPRSLENMAKYMIEDLGLVDLQIIDLRHVQPASPFGPNDIMLLCSGKGSRHLTKASQSLIGYVKQNYNQLADTEGILSSNFLRVYNRRLRKRAQRQGTANREFMAGGDSTGTMVDRTGSWVVLDTKVDGIYIHIFTEERRSEVDLEGYWSQKSKGISELVDLPKSKFEKRFVLPGSRRGFATSIVASNVKATLAETVGSSSTASVAPTVKAAVADAHINNTPTAHTSKLSVDSTDSAVVEEPVPSESQNYLDELQKWSLAGDYKRCIRLKSFAPELTAEENQKSDTLILKAHLNYLAVNQKTIIFSEITPTCDIVSSFINAFPTEPMPLQWRLRLIFLQKLHTINEPAFPLNLLVEHITLQQASGVPIEPWDVEMVVATIAYSHQFTNKKVNNLSVAEWEAVCDNKLQLILQVHEVAFRSTGEVLSVSDSLVALLYRLCFSLSKEGKAKSIVPSEALADPTPSTGVPNSYIAGVTGKRAFVDPRATTMMGLFGGEGGAKMTKPIVILIMSVLINGGSWDKFWSFWTNINRYTIVDQDLLAVMVSLVTKTGDQANMIHLLEKYLPTLLTDLERTGVSILPETAEALKASVQYLDPARARYDFIRNFLGC